MARERIFARTWQWIGDLADVAEPGSLAPRELLPGLVDAPLLLTRDGGGTLRCISNVCTHRGNILVKQACRADQIRCSYHSRRFDLAGHMTFMPEFAEVRNFPSPADNLEQIPFAAWVNHGFAVLDTVVRLVFRSTASGSKRRRAATTRSTRTGRSTSRITWKSCTFPLSIPA